MARLGMSTGEPAAGGDQTRPTTCPFQNAKFIGWNPYSLLNHHGRTQAISHEFKDQCAMLFPRTH
eukprot:6743432-Pyramimonas_sp.AAC.1